MTQIYFSEASSLWLTRSKQAQLRPFKKKWQTKLRNQNFSKLLRIIDKGILLQILRDKNKVLP